MDDYTKTTINYMNNQKFEGVLENYDKKFYAKSSVCGDWNEIYVSLNGDIIRNISYKNFGCALNITVLEIVCKFLVGKSISEIENLSENFLKEKLNFPESKKHCVSLVFDSFKN